MLEIAWFYVIKNLLILSIWNELGVLIDSKTSSQRHQVSCGHRALECLLKSPEDETKLSTLAGGDSLGDWKRGEWGFSRGSLIRG